MGRREPERSEGDRSSTEDKNSSAPEPHPDPEVVALANAHTAAMTGNANFTTPVPAGATYIASIPYYPATYWSKASCGLNGTEFGGFGRWGVIWRWPRSRRRRG